MTGSARKRPLVGLAGVALAAVVAVVAVSTGNLAGLPYSAEATTSVTPAPSYTIDQAISDRAQQNTIAFDALGFLTGSLGSDSFFPPGKVADFWGFQYLRDNDPSAMGHNTDFLTKAALNMYSVLTPEQRLELKALATRQVPAINDYGYKRFVLMDAFRRLQSGRVPTGTAGLSPAAVKEYSAALYRLDGEISYERASVMGPILASLSDEQKAALDALVGKGMTEWPNVEEPEDMRGLSQDEKVAVMTYSGDLFSWYAGTVDADVYFCPERHGTYFGSFYLKDAKAVGNPGYSIPTTITGDMGENFLAALTDAQRLRVTGLLDAQRGNLSSIVLLRRQASEQLRLFRSGSVPDKTAFLNLMSAYGEQDGNIAFLYASAFSDVGKTLSDSQRTQFASWRQQMVGDLEPTGAFLYSQPIAMPQIQNTDFLFAAPTFAVTSLNARPKSGGVALTWVNPVDFSATRIYRSQASFAKSPTGGTGQVRIYEGPGTAYNDVQLVNGTLYYYTAFARDRAGRWSVPTTATARPKAPSSLVVSTTTVTATSDATVTLSARVRPKGSGAGRVAYLERLTATGWQVVKQRVMTRDKIAFRVRSGEGRTRTFRIRIGGTSRRAAAVSSPMRVVSP